MSKLTWISVAWVLVVGCSQPAGDSAPTVSAVANASATTAAPLPALAANAPKDQPITAEGEALAETQRAIAPYVKQARATYPQAKQRYLNGLPAGEHFFVTTTLHSGPNTETVFVAVLSLDGDTITGTIASDLITVTGYRAGDSYTFSEAELVDWLITKPDGSEEGNVVGKFLDGWRPSGG